jgi:hypothetical protein
VVEGLGIQDGAAIRPTQFAGWTVDESGLAHDEVDSSVLLRIFSKIACARASQV